MLRTLMAAMAITLALVGCSDDSDSGGSAPDAESSAPNLEEFCTAFEDTQSDEGADLEAVEVVYRELVAKAPTEISDEVAEFVEQAREVTTAFAPAADGQEVDVAAILGSLSDEASRFLEDFTSATQTGEFPEGVVGDVFQYVQDNC